MAEIEFLEKELGKENIFAISGMHLSSQQTGPKILWLQNNEPDVWEKTAMILTASGFLAYRLTGEATLDFYTATGGYSPLVDGEKLAWSDTMAKHIVSLDKLPRLVWATEVVGQVTKDAAAETGLKQGTPVVAGTADAGSEAISVGLSQPGDLMVMYGSSIFFILKTEKKLPTQRFWAANFLEPDTYVVTGGMSTAGSITRWFRDEFSQIEMAEEEKGGAIAYVALEKLAQKSRPGSRGLIALPYFYGERTPIHDPRARGLIAGLTLNHTRSDIYRAFIESIGFGIRHNIDELQREGVSSKRILAVGGGVKNNVCMQSVSDIIGLEQIIPDEKYGACYGDAFLAGVGIGIFKSSSEITEWISAEKTIRPNPENKNIYDELYRQYKSLYIQNQSIMHELSDLQNTA
jgi:xylulokinase